MGHNLVKVGHEIGSNIELSNDEDEDVVDVGVDAGMKSIFSLFNS